MFEEEVDIEKYKTYYDLEIEKLIEDINRNEFKQVLLQFPDGLKYYAKEVIDEIKRNCDCEIFTYFGTCFGACDVPLHLKDLGFDLCVQWGHSVYVKRPEMW